VSDAGLDPRIEGLLDSVEAHYVESAPWTGRSRLSDRVRKALARVPRHVFVPPEESDLAYADMALPIGHGQTISQPFIVALMTDLLDLPAKARVLEVGSGSGYQAAVLSNLADRVIGIELNPDLATTAREHLKALGLENVEIHQGDGWYGWPSSAPYDGILVACAPQRIPPPLLDQLAPGGRMVLPLGPPGGRQTLTLVEKTREGEILTEDVLPVAFVPLRHPDAEGEADQGGRPGEEALDDGP